MDSTVFLHLRCILLLVRTPNLLIPSYIVQAVCVTHGYPGVLSLLSDGKEGRGSLSCGLLYPEHVHGIASVFAELSIAFVSMCWPQLWPLHISDTHTLSPTYSIHQLVWRDNYWWSRTHSHANTDSSWWHHWHLTFWLAVWLQLLHVPPFTPYTPPDTKNRKPLTQGKRNAV